GDGGVAGVRGFPGGDALVRPAGGREPPPSATGLVAARRDAAAGANRAVGERDRLRRPPRRAGGTGRRVAAGAGGVAPRPGGAAGLRDRRALAGGAEAAVGASAPRPAARAGGDRPGEADGARGSVFAVSVSSGGRGVGAGSDGRDHNSR